MAGSMTRRERERQRHIEHILDVAESVFAERGFFRATMRQIALKAEFALGTIYSHFRNKTGLYEKVIETKTSDLVGYVLRQMESERSARGQVEKFIHAKITFLRENLSFLRLYLAEVSSPRADAEHVLPAGVRERYGSMLRGLTDAIRRGIREGVFRPMDAEMMARTLDGLTNAFALSRLGSDMGLSVGSELRAATELLFHGMVARR